MASFGNLVQKAFYLGVGIASYTGEKVGGTLKDVREQAQKLVDEMVARGEMTAEEAQRLVNEMVARAQQDVASSSNASSPSAPRRIEILDNNDESSLASSEYDQAEALRRQVAALREELEQLKRRSS